MDHAAIQSSPGQGSICSSEPNRVKISIRVAFCAGIFPDHTQFAVRQTNSLGNQDGFSCHSVVPTHKIGGFAAGNFQPLCIHIFLPRVLVVIREDDFIDDSFPRHILLNVENILPSKPLLVHQIVLRVADPAWCEHLCLVTGAVGLMLQRLFYTGLDQCILVSCSPVISSGRISCLKPYGSPNSA